MTDAEVQCWDEAYAYAFRVYGGERPGADVKRIGSLAERYAHLTVTESHGASAVERLRLRIEHLKKTTPTEGPYLR